jgi:hypothetical protein
MAERAEHSDMVHPVLSHREACEVFDREVRRLMGMSGEEFIRRWKANEYTAIADEPGSRHIIRLALMMPGDGQ